VLQLALEQSSTGRTQVDAKSESPQSETLSLDFAPYPEKIFTQERERERVRAYRQASFRLGAAAAMALLLWATKRNRGRL
jgi:hypothetical protein